MNGAPPLLPIYFHVLHMEITKFVSMKIISDLKVLGEQNNTKPPLCQYSDSNDVSIFISIPYHTEFCSVSVQLLVRELISIYPINV
jgi:hypothetical protein